MPMDRGAWKATGHSVAKRWTWLSNWAQCNSTNYHSDHIINMLKSNDKSVGFSPSGRPVWVVTPSSFMRRCLCGLVGVPWSQHKNSLFSSKNISTVCMISFIIFQLIVFHYFTCYIKKTENSHRNKKVPIFQFSRTSPAYILILISHFASYHLPSFIDKDRKADIFL